MADSLARCYLQTNVSSYPQIKPWGYINGGCKAKVTWNDVQIPGSGRLEKSGKNGGSMPEPGTPGNCQPINILYY